MYWFVRENAIMKHPMIIGQGISARSVEVADSEYILQLRLNKELNSFIHVTSPDIKAQREWIQDQQKKDDDYYFVLADLDAKPFGLAAIYHIHDHMCEFGRWISEGNAFQNLETVILLHDFAFDTLELERVNTFTRKANNKVVRFWQRFGTTGFEEIYTNGILYHHSWLDKNTYINKIRPSQLQLLASRR
jgi:RimJ/RimL family protein N-acetyltransferase